MTQEILEPQNVVAAAADNGSILALMFFSLMFGVGVVMSADTPAVAVTKTSARLPGASSTSSTACGVGKRDRSIPSSSHCCPSSRSRR